MPIEGLESKDVKGFLGVNIRLDSIDIRETEEGDIELLRCVNADKHTQPKTILLRKGREEQFSSALADLIIRQLARVNAIRYEIAGTNLYRDQVDVNDYRQLDLDGSRLHTTIVGFKPLDDTSIWAFVADRSARLKDDGTDTFRWGLPTPDAFEVSQQQSATYTYIIGVTHLRVVGDSTIAHESNAKEVTITETV